MTLSIWEHVHIPEHGHPSRISKCATSTLGDTHDGSMCWSICLKPKFSLGHRGVHGHLFYQEASVLFTIFHNATVNSQSVHLTSERLQEKNCSLLPCCYFRGWILPPPPAVQERLAEEHKEIKSWSELLGIFHVQHALVNLRIQRLQGPCEVPSTPVVSVLVLSMAQELYSCAWLGFFMSLLGPLCIHDPEHAGPSYPDQG